MRTQKTVIEIFYDKKPLCYGTKGTIKTKNIVEFTISGPRLYAYGETSKSKSILFDVLTRVLIVDAIVEIDGYKIYCKGFFYLAKNINIPQSPEQISGDYKVELKINRVL